jgi:hypothetical protein
MSDAYCYCAFVGQYIETCVLVNPKGVNRPKSAILFRCPRLPDSILKPLQSPLEPSFPLILAFSLGEKERLLWPAWKSKAALTNPVASFLAKRGACLPLPEGEGWGEGERRMADQEAIRARCRPSKGQNGNLFYPV